jgi:hypothetical protein
MMFAAHVDPVDAPRNDKEFIEYDKSKISRHAPPIWFQVAHASNHKEHGGKRLMTDRK